MENRSKSYVVVTPVRDEEEHLTETIQSMLKQTVLPRQWIVVDDGSTDRTQDIIGEYAGRHPWIVPVYRSNRGFRKSGSGVVEAFNDGYRAITCGDWSFVVKFDGDLIFAPDYFERCFERFLEDPRLGIGGGVICYDSGGGRSIEKAPLFHVRGATKIYRRECWEAIGGLLAIPGWDTFDEIKANSLGWNTRSFGDLQLIHQRDTGAADGQWASSVKYGRANYICGYHPLFMLAKCARRVPKPPFVLGAAGILYGYVAAYVAGIPRVPDAPAIAYLRQQQINRLLGRQSIWG
jgi:glycosyltransferase involved in cell wall biosynthesis